MSITAFLYQAPPSSTVVCAWFLGCANAQQKRTRYSTGDKGNRVGPTKRRNAKVTIRLSFPYLLKETVLGSFSG